MDNDIVERLRHAEDNGICEWQVLIDAADEIERLWKLADQLANALRAVQYDRPSAHTDDEWAAINQALLTYEEASGG